MALPEDVTTFELTFGPYTDAAGEPVFAGMTGKIKPSFPQIRHVESGAVVIDSPIPVEIDGFGVASVQLAHTDQAVLSPVGFTYSVVWSVASRKPSPGNKQIAVPTSAGAEVDFDLLAPSPDVEGVVVPLTYGKSAYDLAVENGFVGTEAAWLATLKGDPGTADDADVAPLITDQNSATSVALRSAFEAVVKVDTFGAVGDGTADDAAAFQAAIDAVSAAGGGVLMCTRAKTYKLRNVRLKAKVALDLNGATLQYGGTNGTVAPLELEPAILYAEGTAGSPLEGIVVRGGTFRGTRAAGDYNATQAGHHDGVQFNHTRAGLIENCAFIDIPQDPITLGGSTAGSSAGTTARGNYIKDCGDAAIEVRTGSDYLITGNTALGVRNLVASKPNVDRVTVIGNKALTYGHGIIGHGSDWLIQSNTIGTFATADAQDGATTAGIHISDQGGGSFTATDCARWTITGNTITGRTNSQGLEIPTGGTWTVTDVIFKNNNVVSRRGVLASKGAGIYVSGNRLKCGDGGGVQANGTATKMSVVDNDIDATGAGNGVDITVAAAPIVLGNRITTAAVGINLGSATTDARVEANTVAAATSALTAFGTRASLRGNRCTTTGGATITLSGADAVVDGNTLSPTGGEGVLIQAGATAAVTTGNRIIGGTQGIRVGGNDGTVVGNRCSGAQFWGVNISTGVTGALLTGNHLKGNTSGAISDSGTGTTTGTNVTV